MDTSDRQIAETGRNRELGLIPAMVMAVVATLSGAAVANNWPAALSLTVLAIVAIVATRGRLAFEQSNR